MAKKKKTSTEQVIRSTEPQGINLDHRKKKQILENIVHGIFLLLGLIAVGGFTDYRVLVYFGIPAIHKIGIVDFLFGREWVSIRRGSEIWNPAFILTSIYGTAGAVILGVPIGFMTSVYLSKIASPRVKSVMQSAVSLLAAFLPWSMVLSACLYWFPASGKYLTCLTARLARGNYRFGNHDFAVHH